MPDTQYPIANMITLTGLLERITYQNGESHYLIGKLRSEESQSLFTVVGYMTGVHAGEKIALNGKWQIHPKYGQQFKVDSFNIILPSERDDIDDYLKSGIIKGIGAKTAGRIIQHFKDNALNIIEKHPEKLIEVQGIGVKTAQKITESWKKHHGLRELSAFLNSNGMPGFYVSKILACYGKDAISIIRNSPYRLIRDIPEIDFSNVDALALKLGLLKNDPGRVKACIEHLLAQFVNEGNTYMPKSLLAATIKNRFKIESDDFEQAMDDLIDAHSIATDNFLDNSGSINVYPRNLYEAETGIAVRLKALLTIPFKKSAITRDDIIFELLNKIAIKLSQEQLDVLENILPLHTAIITGGPGTGKTTLIRSLSVIYSYLGKKILLAAPTGRAARRLSEVTQRKAETIHKLLGYNPSTETFEKNNKDLLDADAVIVDEASMIDTHLMYHLLEAMPLSGTMILVGDAFQLPSVGPGNVLSDIISSNSIKLFELKEIFRQAHESPIITNAHKIKNGGMPELKGYEGLKKSSEFIFIELDEPEDVVKSIIEMHIKKIPEQLDLENINEVQVITPMHKGEVGTLNLNHILQKAINPDSKPVKATRVRFRLNDKVMHLKNNYQKEVFNGDIGIISDINNEEQTIHVKYDERTVEYNFEELDELSLAYAISVHKSQGSEYPAVIIPLLTQHFPLLQRNLLYTAVTRGKNLVVIIGTKKALLIALNNDKPRQRLSGLAQRLK